MPPPPDDETEALAAARLGDTALPLRTSSPWSASGSRGVFRRLGDLGFGFLGAVFFGSIISGARAAGGRTGSIAFGASATR